MVLAVRLLLLATPIAIGSVLLPVLHPTSTGWHVLGRLFLLARGFTLLASPLGFGLEPRITLPLHTAAVGVAMWRVHAACGCGFLQLPKARSSLEG